MDIANLGASFPAIQAHLQFFAFLLFALPAMSFIGIKFWLAARSTSNAPRIPKWYVPPSEDSEGANCFFDYESSPKTTANARLFNVGKR
jgi:hypothetical protein